jgi:DNA-binding CsgD family transcriptional regulator
MMRAPNPIDVVELAYSLDGTDPEWLQGLARSIYPLLDGGLGLHTYRFDLALTPAQWLETQICIDLPDESIAAIERFLVAWSSSPDLEKMHQAHVAPNPLSHLSETLRQEGLPDLHHGGWNDLRDMVSAVGARDMLALRTIEPGGKGLILLAPQRTERAIDRRTKHVWSRVSSHIAAARRLRERVASEEAWLTPGGKLDHAEGDATSRPVRDALRAAVLRQERARGRARREDPDGATEAWTALVSGRWSLVDHFERGGRRFIVARRNEHGCLDPRALTDRERDVVNLAALGKANKLIAYELGLSESTVATHLGHAMRKLRVKTRVQLLPVLMKLMQR